MGHDDRPCPFAPALPDHHPALRLASPARPVATTDLIEPLARRGIPLSSSQVYRLVAERPERLSLKILMALLDILDCSMTELIEPVAAGGRSRTAKAGGDATAGVGQLRPKRARITRAGE